MYLRILPVNPSGGDDLDGTSVDGRIILTGFGEVGHGILEVFK
jgi:hypothetical protein